jgi:phage terminase large subunit GpA-like protein
MLIAPFKRAHSVLLATAELLLPPRRDLPSNVASQNLRNEKGPWDRALSPMMIEPMDLLGSRDYQGIVLVASARSTKSFSLVLGGITYVVTSAPGDALVVQMSKDAARDWSRIDFDRVIRHSPALSERLSPRAKDDNTHDKFFRSGIVVKIGWPAVSQLSSKTLQYVFMPDYDRPQNRDDVDGEGPMWDLGFKRTETYMSRGKCVAESSPEAVYLKPKWTPATPHEAPPARGILEIYNRGTRARWYWPCLQCGERFEAEPGLGCFRLPAEKKLEESLRGGADPMELASRYARVPCIKCGAVHEQTDRAQMNALGQWVHEGEQIRADGTIAGERRRTNIASYWFGGVAAPYQSWSGMLHKYFEALLSYLRTSEESALKFTVNTDQAAAYVPRSVVNKRSVEELKQRTEYLERGQVPQSVRFLTAAIDVQQTQFVVEVFGWGVELECWIIDRFTISSSRRPEGDRTAALNPAAYLEDWQLLLPEVIERTYPIAESELVMPIRQVLSDSGGRAGVTARAYEFFRWLRAQRKHRTFRLVKGEGAPNRPTIRLSFPDARDNSERRESGARGDVPVWILNTNVLKDAVIGDLARTVAGQGYVHLPKWLEQVEGFFAEYEAEQRTDKGWKNPSGARNEAFDLHGYNKAACKILRADKINWRAPPSWARPFEQQGLKQRGAAVTPKPPPGVPPRTPYEPRPGSNFFSGGRRGPIRR